MRIVTFFLSLTFLSLSPGATGSDYKTAQEPSYEVALTFLHSYLDYLNDRNVKIGRVEWIRKQTTVTENFKTTLTKFIESSEFLDFDPILDAQDYPEGFEIYETDSEFVIVKGTDWPGFKLTLKLLKVGKEWLVDGSGVINVPKERRRKR